MPRGDWTNPAACEHMLDFEAAEFAAEYVMRNDAVIAEYQALASRQKARAGDLIGTPEFTDRWGLRFRGGC